MQSSSSKSAPSEAAPPSMATVLHRHALESILGFFRLRELPQLMHICHAFRSAIVSMAPLLEQVHLSRSRDIASVCKSPLIAHVGSLLLSEISPQSLALLTSKAAHVRSLDLSPSKNLGAGLWVLPSKLARLVLSLEAASSALINSIMCAAGSLCSLVELDMTLPSFARFDLAPLSRLDSLHKLTIMVGSLCDKAVHPQASDAAAGPEASLMLPPKLTRLTISLLQPSQTAATAMINRFLVATGSLSSLGRFEVVVPSFALVDLAPLTRLHSLHTLSLATVSRTSSRDREMFTSQQHDDLRGLSRSLTTLRIYPALTEQSIRQLFRAGHSFRLKDLGSSLHVWLTSEIGELIASLPLESLDVRPAHTLEFLSRLAPTLRTLQMQLYDCAVKPDAIAEALSHLTGLTSLWLTGSTLTSAHLAIPMRSLTHLTQLHLNSMTQLHSLAFLAEAGAPQLEALTLENCSHPQFSPLELQHLRRSQPQLTWLSLTNTFNAPLDVFSLSLLEPPSIVFPLLDEFDYKFRDPNEFEESSYRREETSDDDDED